MIAITNAFGLSREPFAQEIPVEDLCPLPGLEAFRRRFQYALRLPAATVITGDVGSGKSTSLRAATAALHPTQFVVLSIVATSGSMLELLRQISLELGDPQPSNSTARLMRTIRDLVASIAEKKRVPVLTIDEAHLLRLDVFRGLHTLAQMPFDHASILPLVLSGQNSLIDKLMFHTSKPFASRVVGRTHLDPLKLADMQTYLLHHLQIAGAKQQILAEEAITAIHQSSGGLLRRAGHLARGAMLAAAAEQAPIVTAEHVRLASTEIL
jgi:type II secretory pathway predicted ATPase ExeA